MSNKHCSLRLASSLTGSSTYKGFHNFERAFISPEDTDDMLVSKHEGTHDKFLIETSFGHAQLAFKQLYEYCDDQKVKTNAGIWVDTLAGASHLTHESGATYLSIKLFDYHLEKELLSGHPEEYKQYFRALSDIIDAVFHASYAQYIVGKIIVEVSLASPTFRRLGNWSLEMPIELSDKEKPDNRFRTLLPVIKPRLNELLGLVTEGIQNKATGLLIESFDFQSEDSWLSLTTGNSTLFEGEIHALIRQWIYPIAESLFPCVHDKELPQDTSQFLSNIQKRTGTDLNRTGLWAVTDQDIPQDSPLIIRAIREGATSIDNSQLARQIVLRNVDETAAPISVFTHPPGRRVFITQSLKNADLSSLRWNRFIVDGDSQVVIGGKLTHNFFKRALASRNVIAFAGLPVPAADLVVVGLHSDEPEGSNALSTEVIACYSKATSGKNLFVQLEPIVWYLGGDFFKWYYDITAAGPIETLVLYKEGSAPEMSDEDVKKYNRGEWSVKDDLKLQRVEASVVWLILRSPAFTGLCLRIVPAGSFHDMSHLLLKDLNSGRQKPFPIDERQKIADQVLRARIPIMLSWEHY